MKEFIVAVFAVLALVTTPVIAQQTMEIAEVTEQDVMAACTGSGATPPSCEGAVAASFAYLRANGADPDQVNGAITNQVVQLASIDVPSPPICAVRAAGIRVHGSGAARSDPRNRRNRGDL